ncbi:MAG: hypothetical protein JWO67_1558 [Streptosporangiaceae bacterium]|nr:hypothetical protein [Streptosporangiaceae bacterium]
MKNSPMPRRTKPMPRRTGLNPGQKPLTSTTPIKPRSAKTVRRYVERRALVAELFADPTVCEVPWCASPATDPHEPLTRARGGSIVDRDNVRLICRIHHSEIHDTEPPWAYELGFLAHSWDRGDAA